MANRAMYPPSVGLTHRRSWMGNPMAVGSPRWTQVGQPVPTPRLIESWVVDIPPPAAAPVVTPLASTPIVQAVRRAAVY